MGTMLGFHIYIFKVSLRLAANTKHFCYVVLIHWRALLVLLVSDCRWLLLRFLIICAIQFSHCGVPGYSLELKSAANSSLSLRWQVILTHQLSEILSKSPAFDLNIK